MTLLADDLTALQPSDGALALLFRPEVDLATGAIVAMEGRLPRRTGGAVPAADDRCADSVPMGHRVLRAGAAEAEAWQRLPGRTRRLWLAVSVTQVREPGYAELLAGVVAEHRLPAGALGLELSERTVRALGSDAAPLLHDLRAAGVALVVGDFASWYSSLGAMDLLPLSAIRLGQQHVRDVDECRREPVATAVVRAAHERGLPVVAEGVQTWGEAARLTELGCDRARGRLIAGAQRADQVRRLLCQGRGWRGSEVSVVLPGPRTP